MSTKNESAWSGLEAKIYHLLSQYPAHCKTSFDAIRILSDKIAEASGGHYYTDLLQVFIATSCYHAHMNVNIHIAKPSTGKTLAMLLLASHSLINSRNQNQRVVIYTSLPVVVD